MFNIYLIMGQLKGNRNNSTVALANSLFQVGKEYNEVLEIISYWNATKNEDPLDESEIRTTVQSAYNNAQAIDIMDVQCLKI